MCLHARQFDGALFVQIGINLAYPEKSKDPETLHVTKMPHTPDAEAMKDDKRSYGESAKLVIVIIVLE